MKRDGLAELVDGFGRTADAPFVLDELLGFLDERTGKRVDEREVFDLAASSGYLFESWDDPMATKFIPRRRFFQGAEFLITPTTEEVQGGILFPGHRFMPFLCRDVFPADVWLLDGDSAPHIKRIDVPRVLAEKALRFYGETHAASYLVSDNPANNHTGGTLSVSAFDLRDFYLANGFKPGDSIRVKVLDWLQGVLSLSYVSAGAVANDIEPWTAAMRRAFGRMQTELGSEGDCYEQLAIMMLLGVEGGGVQIMENPPLALDTFIDGQSDIVLREAGDRAVLDLQGIQGAGTLLDSLFKELGLSVTEAEAEAYMRDALYRGAGEPGGVLARIFSGHSLVFRSAGKQDDFHRLWDDLWNEVAAVYSRDADVRGGLRSELLVLKDRCIATEQMLGSGKAGLEELMNKPGVREFGMLTASLSGILALLNADDRDIGSSAKELETLASVIFNELPKVLDTITG